MLARPSMGLLPAAAFATGQPVILTFADVVVWTPSLTIGTLPATAGVLPITTEASSLVGSNGIPQHSGQFPSHINSGCTCSSVGEVVSDRLAANGVPSVGGGGSVANSNLSISMAQRIGNISSHALEKNPHALEKKLNKNASTIS